MCCSADAVFEQVSEQVSERVFGQVFERVFEQASSLVPLLDVCSRVRWSEGVNGE